MSVLYWESSYFSQILKADLNDTKFSRGSTWLHYMDDLLLHLPSQASSQEDRSHLLKLFALKGHSVAKEKLQFAQTQVSYLGHIIWEQGLYPDPDRLHYALSFLQTQNWVSALRFLKLVDDYQKWIPNFSVMAKPLNNTNPILWEEPDGIVFKVLKESLMNPHALGYPNY